MYPMGNISVKLGLEQLVSSNPRPHQNLIHFDLSKLAKRPLLGRHLISLYVHRPAKLDPTTAAQHPMPVMILARLAVDVQHQGAGLGKALLKDALLVKDLKAMLSGRDQAQADQSVVFA